MPRIRDLDAYARGNGWPSAAAMESAAHLVLKLQRGGRVEKSDCEAFAKLYPAVAAANPNYIPAMAAKLNAAADPARECVRSFGYDADHPDTATFLKNFAEADLGSAVERALGARDVAPATPQTRSPAQARAHARSDDENSRRDHINALLMGRQPTPGEHRARIANALDHTAAMSTVLAEAPRFPKFSSQSPGKADSEHRHDSVAAAYDALALKGEAHEVLDADAVGAVEQAGGGGGGET